MQRRPLGQALVGNGFLYAHPTPRLFFSALFGRPDASAISTWLRALPVELAAGVKPHVSVIDARRLHSVDADGFTALAAYVSREGEQLARRVERLCLVRPQGMSGAVVAGFFSVVDAPYPVLVTDTLAEAPAFLGDAAPAALLTAMDALVTRVAGQPELLSRLSALLAQHRFSLDVAQAARALSLSTRTLQRRLSESGTSFVDVVREARLETARRKLAAGGEPLLAIALECGFSSSQHFAAAFKAVHGVTPSAWRRSQRARP